MNLFKHLTEENIFKIQEIKDIDELLNIDEYLDSYIKEKLLE